jgi:hypothetical protein
MSYPAWPFLRARTETAPFRLVVVPEAIGTDQAALHELEKAITEGRVIHGGTVNRRTIRLGDDEVVLGFRVVSPHRSTYGLPGTGEVTDWRGREFEVTEGVAVWAGDGSLDVLEIGPADLDQAQRSVIEPYQRFWQQARAYRPEFSTPFEITGEEGPATPEPGQPAEPQQDPAGNAAEPPPASRADEPVFTPTKPVPRPRRGRLILAGAAAAAGTIAAVAAVIIQAGSAPLVLQPAGLQVDLRSTTSIALSWHNPQAGPMPTRYEITRDGRPVGFTSGGAPVFVSNDLSAGRAYRFQVIAFRGSRRSRASGTLRTQTIANPPLLAGLLIGSWHPAAQVTASSSRSGNFIPGRPTTQGWTFNPCQGATCQVSLSGTITGRTGRERFTLRLHRTSGGYEGRTKARLDACSSPVGPVAMPGVLSVALRPSAAAYRGGTWAVTAWQASLSIASDYLSPRCPARTVKVRVTAGS